MPESARGRRASCAWLVLAALLLASLPALAAPRIGVMTMGPGSEYWSRFGHNAVLVEAEDGSRLVYNYGYFDFEQPGFLTGFMRGRMLYRLLALPYERDLAYYAEAGRSVSLQWLDLPDNAASEVAAFLAWNARPENAEYRYDYFLDNCSTRVRDVVDRALDGAFKEQTGHRSRGLTQRGEALRLSAPDAWMYWGIHLLLAVPTDRAMSRWEESFVPQHLHDALQLVRLEDGRPLVSAEEHLLPQRIAAPRSETPRYVVGAGLLGILLGLLIVHGARRSNVYGSVARGLLGGFWLFCGVAAALMLGLWWGTDHSAAYANRNLWLFPPSSALLLFALPQLRAGREVRVWATALTWLGACSWIAGLAAYALPLRPQDTLEWLLLSAPLHLAALWLFRRQPASMEPG